MPYVVVIQVSKIIHLHQVYLRENETNSTTLKSSESEYGHEDDILSIDRMRSIASN